MTSKLKDPKKEISDVEIKQICKKLCVMKPCCLNYLLENFDVKYHQLLKKISTNAIWDTETGYPCKDKCIKK